MVLFNYSTRELTAKVVYYGPGLCGKTTNLQYIYENLPGSVKGKMLSLATKTDRTLFFDFLPIDLGEIRGMRTRIQLYTVPGQVFYNETRRLVLKGADGVVFVADSQKQMLEANLDSFSNLEENLIAHGMKLSPIPLVLQLNKRDLPNVASVEELNAAINKYNAPFYESVATTGIGVQDTLKAITKLVLLHLTKKYDPRRPGAAAQPAAGGSSVSVPGPSANPSATLIMPRPPAPAPPARAPLAARSGEGATAAPRMAPAAGRYVEAPTAAGAGLQESLPAVPMPPPPPMEFLGGDDSDDPIVELVEIADDDAPMTLGPPASPAAAAARAAAPAGPGPSGAVRLEPVSETDELFEPGSSVARFDAERPAEIVVPLEISAGGEVRRFRLKIALDLSEVANPDR